MSYTGLRLTGRNAVVTRPADKPQAEPGNTWARDRSIVGADDGTEIDATWVNRVKAIIENAVGGLGGSLGAGDDQLLNAILGAIDSAVEDRVAIGALLTDLDDGDGFVRMTDAERTKLNSLTLNFQGVHVDLAALETAVPEGESGYWAVLTQGDGDGATLAVWDTDETPPAWVDTGVSGSIPSHSHDIADVTGLSAALAAKLAAASNLSDVANPATAFGNIKQAATDAATGVVELATDAETQTGTDAVRAITPANLTAKEATAAQYRNNTADRILTTDVVWAAMAEVALADGATITPDFGAGIDFGVTLGGNRTLANPTAPKVGQKGRIRLTQDGTGSRTLAYGSSYKWAGGIVGVLSTAAGSIDFLDYDVHTTTHIRVALSKGSA